MKTTKRVLAFLIGFMMLMTAANAAVINGDEITAPPDDWTLTSAGIENGDMLLHFDTRSSAERAKSEITTSEYNELGKVLLLSFDSIASVQINSSKVEQSISLVDDDAFHTNKLISIKDGSMTIFGAAAEVACEEDTAHRITLAVDPTGDTVKAAAWLDNTLVYSGEYSAWKTALDMSAVKVAFKNNATASISDKAEWSISDFEMKALDGAYNFSTIPADGQAMVAPSVGGITLNFGTRMSDLMYADANYTLSDSDGAVPFRAEKSGDQVKLIPEEGLRDLTEYTLTIEKITDLWGNEKIDAPKIITFSTAFEGYLPPVVSVIGETSVSIFKGQAQTIAFSVDKDIEKMEILVDGICEEELTKAPYTYTVSESEPETIRVMAAAYDEYGGVSYSPEVTVEIKDHNAPELFVSGIDSGAKYGTSELPTAEISATDDNGIKMIEVYADGRLLRSSQSDTLSFSLSELSAGAHTLKVSASDIYGLVTSKDYAVEIVSDTLIESYRNDFSTYKGNNTLPDGMAGGSQRGYLDVGTIDEEHGKSLLIGIDEADLSFAETNTAYVGIPTGDVTGTVEVEFEMNISAKPASNYRFSTKRTGGAENVILFITPTSIRLCNKNWSPSKTMDYTPGEWYRFKLSVDVPNRKYVVSVTDKNGNGESETGTLDSGYDVLNYVRVFGPADDSIKSFVAVDNVLVQQAMPFPTLTIEENIPYQAESVTITSSQTLNTSDLNKENITLSDAFGKVAVRSVMATDGKTIVITPAVSLRSSMEYKVTISPNVRYSAGIPIGAAIDGYFRTTAKDFDILSGGFDGGVFTFKAVNSGEEKAVTVIVQKWTSDGECRSVSAREVLVQSGEDEYSVAVPAVSGGDYVTVYIWDGIVSPNPVTPQIWTLR